MTLKAYQVQDEFEGNAVIEFSAHAVTARRNGANELNTEFGDVSCRRAPWADSYVPGPVPSSVLIENGWWLECGCGCGRQIDDEGCRAEDYEENPMSPVFEGRFTYWNQACKDSWDAEVRARADKLIQDQAEAEKVVAEEFPGATQVKAHRHYCPNAKEKTALAATFHFPGGKGRVNWTLGAETLNVLPDDREAWELYCAARKGST